MTSRGDFRRYVDAVDARSRVPVARGGVEYIFVSFHDATRRRIHAVYSTSLTRIWSSVCLRRMSAKSPPTRFITSGASGNEL